MIPREILKQIRQIEIHAIPLVAQRACSHLSQPSLKFLGIAFSVEHGDDYDARRFLFDSEENRILPIRDSGLSGKAADQAKSLRVFCRLLHYGPHVTPKSPSDPRLPLVVPFDSVVKLLFRLGLDEDLIGHFWAR